MKIPKANYHIGEAVNVRQKEAERPPAYRGRVIGIRVDQHGELDYTILADDGGMFDGYNESWISPANVPHHLPPPRAQADGKQDSASLDTPNSKAGGG